MLSVFLDFGHSNRCVVVSHRCFNLHCPDAYDVVHLFIHLFATCISSLVRCLFRSSAYFLIGWVSGLFSCCWVLSVLCTPETNIINQLYLNFKKRKRKNKRVLLFGIISPFINQTYPLQTFSPCLWPFAFFYFSHFYVLQIGLKYTQSYFEQPYCFPWEVILPNV